MTVLLGFGYIFIAAVSAGAFGLQYRIQRIYTVENTALLSMLFATIVVPLIACSILLPGWPSAITGAGMGTLLTVYLLGFGWGLGAITYAFGFNMLGMALAHAIIGGITIAVGTGVPLIRRWAIVPMDAKLVTIIGVLILIAGTALSGKAGIMRERDDRTNGNGGREPETPYPDEMVPGGMADDMVTSGSQTATIVNKAAKPTVVHNNPTGKVFAMGLTWSVISGVLSACANLGYDFAAPIEKAASGLGHLELYSTLIRWMPMYWGGITALIIFMGGSMIKSGAWRNYFAKGSLHDLLISSSFGGVHFLAQIPYGIGAFFLGELGTTIGFGVNIGGALIIASLIGFVSGEWKEASDAAQNTLYKGLGLLLIGMAILAYANSLA